MLMAVTQAMEALQFLNLSADEWQELSERVAEKAQVANEDRTCQRHGGEWGGDDTCVTCTDEDGNPHER